MEFTLICYYKSDRREGVSSDLTCGSSTSRTRRCVLLPVGKETGLCCCREIEGREGRMEGDRGREEGRDIRKENRPYRVQHKEPIKPTIGTKDPRLRRCTINKPLFN